MGCGFTLIELLVVISIISLLMGIIVPVMGKAKQKARQLISMSNKRQIAEAVNFYACDNNSRFPESVATMTTSGNHWLWRDPASLFSFKRRPKCHRAMSEYLRPYIEDADVFNCPCAPGKFTYLQQAWDVGDEWSNPEIVFDYGQGLSGTLSFYWNYVGYLAEDKFFRGPSGPTVRRGEKKLLASCLLYYYPASAWANEYNFDIYGSCERFVGTAGTNETTESLAVWAAKSKGAVPPAEDYGVSLNAVFVDGHVETYRPNETVRMNIYNRTTKTPHPAYTNGLYFIPKSAIE